MHVPGPEPRRLGRRRRGGAPRRTSARGADARRHGRARRGRARAARRAGEARKRRAAPAGRRVRCASTRSNGRTWRTRRAHATTRREGAVSANRDELSPLALLRRSAQAYPDRVAVRDGERTLSFASFAERAWRLGNALAAARRRARGARRDALAQPQPSCSRRTSACPRPAARCAPSTRGSRRPRCASSSSTAARRCCCSTPSSRPRRAAPSSCRACASCGSGPEYEALLESAAADAARLARQRGSPDLGRLHERHDRHAQGRRLHAPRRVPRRARRPRRDAPRARQQLPLDAAHVPLQRLVLQLGAWRASAPRASCCGGPSRRRSGASCARAPRICARRRRC